MRNGPSALPLLDSTVIAMVKVLPETCPTKRAGFGGLPPIGSGPPPPYVAPVASKSPLDESVHVESILAVPHCIVRLPPARVRVSAA